MVLPILMYGNPILQQKVKQIVEMNDELKSKINDMLETMVAINAAGLAANQVGFDGALMVKRSYASSIQVLINPKIISYGDIKILSEEGCMSLPGIHVNIKRSSKIVVEYHDENFFPQRKTFKVMDAIVIQHEVDHLLGKLLTDGIENEYRIKTLLDRILEKRLDVKYEIKYGDEQIIKIV